MNRKHIRDTAAHFREHVANGGKILIDDRSYHLQPRQSLCNMCHGWSFSNYSQECRKPINFISPDHTWYVHVACFDDFLRASNETDRLLASETRQKYWMMAGLLGDARWIVGGYLAEFARGPAAVFERMCALYKTEK